MPTSQNGRPATRVNPPLDPGHHHGLTITEAAELWGVTRETIRQRVRRGQLVARKVDGQWYLTGDQPRPKTRANRRRLTRSLTADDHAADPGQTKASTTVDREANPSIELMLARVNVQQLEQTVSILQEQLDRTHAALRAEQEALRGEQEAHRRDVSELHVLLQRAQAQIPMPTIAARPQEQPEDIPTPQTSQRRRWWWPFTRTT